MGKTATAEVETPATDEAAETTIGEAQPDPNRAETSSEDDIMGQIARAAGVKTEKPSDAETETEEESKAETTQTGDDSASESEAKKQEDDEHGKLPPEVQAGIDRRIGKEVAKRKELEDRLTEATAKITDLEAKVTQSKPAEESKWNPPEIPPGYITADEGKIVMRDRELQQAEDWLIEHSDGWEGDGTPQNPTLSAPQIRRRLIEVRREREDIHDEARALMKRARQQVSDDLKLAREVRAQREADTKAKADAAAKAKAATPPTAPKVVPSGAPPSRPVSQPAKRGVDENAFKELKTKLGDKGAAARAMGSMIPD